MRQIALPMRPALKAKFEDFIVGDNEHVLTALRDQDNRAVYLFSPQGTGKTHLLSALVAETEAALYVDLEKLTTVQRSVLLEALEGCSCLVLDHLDDALKAPDNKELEHRLFDWINYCRAQNIRLLTASRQPVEELPITLPDLRTRLQWSQVIQLLPLPNSLLPNWLQKCATALELVMPDAVAAYILHHGTRENKQLLEMLQELSAMAKGGQRRLTVPYVKPFLRR